MWMDGVVGMVGMMRRDDIYTQHHVGLHHFKTNPTQTQKKQAHEYPFTQSASKK